MSKKYTYGNRSEWISGEKLDDVKLIDDVIKYSINSKPFVMKDNIANYSKNKKLYKIIDNTEDESLVIKKLVKYREFLNSNIEEHQEILDDNLSISAYNNFLLKLSNSSDNFMFKNIFRDNVPEIEEFVHKSMVKDKISNDNDKKIIQYSIKNILLWNYIDLKNHGIGTEINIRNMIKEMLKPTTPSKIFKYSDYMENMYSAYGLTNFNYDFKRFQHEFIDKDGDTIKGYLTGQTELTTRITKEDITLKECEEIIIYIYIFCLQLIDNLSEASNYWFNKFKKYDLQYRNINKNLNTFQHLIKNGIINYFGISTDIIKVDGKYTIKNCKIEKLYVFNELKDKYSDNIDELIEELIISIIKSANDMDKKGNKLLMGGFIQKPKIAQLSMKYFSNYVKDSIIKKKISINNIDKYLNNIRKGMHISELKKIKNEIRNNLVKIGNISDKTSKDLMAKTAILELITEYENIRNEEIKNLIDLDLIENAIKNNPKKMAKVGNKIVKLRDNTLSNYAHYELKGRSYKVLMFGNYKLLMELNKSNPNKFPQSYLNYMDTEINKVDNKLMAELKNKVKTQNKYEDLKSRMVSKITDKDVISAIDNKITLVSTTKNNNISNYNAELSTYNMKEVEKKKYWVDFKKKLDGMTVYIPYVDDRITQDYGLFDLINAAIEGKIKDKILSGIDNHIISGTVLNEKIISTKLRARGNIMVSNSDTEIHTLNRWRCMDKKDINKMKNMGEIDLRKRIFNILSNKSNYQMNTPNLWSNESKTKKKIIKYCINIDGRDLYKCGLLLSRNKIISKV